MRRRVSQTLLGASLCFSFGPVSGCDLPPPMDITIPAPFVPDYQTVSMLSTLGRTPRFQAEKGRTRIDFGKVQGTLRYSQIADGKVDTVTLERMLGQMQAVIERPDPRP